jgi:hypothetical protein
MITLEHPTAPALSGMMLTCLTRGWSVITLIGGSDVDIGKRPAVPWQRYQKQRPTFDEVQQWFERDLCSAYGVVCGKVSRLIVIDLDTPQAVDQFNQAFPELTHTFTVQSGIRGTPHLYFQVDFPVKTCKLKGGDLKGEGSYVVGPGSSIAGQTWQIVRDEPVRPLSKDELKAILRLLKLSDTASNSLDTLSVRLDRKPSGTFAEGYRRAVQQTGERNNTLFHFGRQMRDTGHSKADVIQQLVDLHARQTARDAQIHETYERRYREALRTIDSVYTRVPQTARSTPTPAIHAADQADPQEHASRLSNRLRERLLQQSDGTAFLRTYEGLRLKGVRPGQIITRPEMFSLLRGIVGEHSIKRTLLIVSPNGQSLLPRITPDGNHATHLKPLKSSATKCFVDTQKPPESHLTPTARAAHRLRKQYQMPSDKELCQWLGIEPEASPQDPIRMEDLQSVRLYRQQLEYELIRRRAGQYPMGWLADRLGVSPRTIYSYHRDTEIEVTACFDSEPITWFNLQQKLPNALLAKRAGIDLRGCYLEDEQGKKYPIRARIAQFLLARKYRLWFKRRRFNFYQCNANQLCDLIFPKHKSLWC